MLSRASTFTLDRLVPDLAIRLAQPVTVGVDALLTGHAVLPNLITPWHSGQAQAVRQDLGDKGLARRTVAGTTPFAGHSAYAKAYRAKVWAKRKPRYRSRRHEETSS